MPTFGGHAFPQHFDRLQADVQLRVIELRDRGLQVEANKMLDAYVELRSGLDALAEKMAARGTLILREHERDSRVRPEGTGELSAALFAEPDPVYGIPGVLGIANYDRLDADVPWWWTQEEGYAGNVGRIVFGAFFHPGPETRPSAKYDKQHAIFEPRASAGQREEEGEGGKRGSMEIRKEIEAKHFLEPAARQILAEWLVAAEALQAAFIAQVAYLP